MLFRSWNAHALTATSYGAGRVWLAGDAVHLFSPTGGFGMNTGVSDAIELAWKLRAVIEGWGGPSLIESYETERRPIGARNTQLAKELYERLADVMTEGDLLDAESAEADGLRARLRTDLIEQESLIASFGVLLGYRYENSPICVPDGSAAPEDHPQHYTPTSRPGHRAPHVWLHDDEALYDRFGIGFNLVRHDSGIDVSSLLAESSRRGIPLDVIDVDADPARVVYECALTLIRPDLMVAWRGNSPPDDAQELWDVVTGWEVGG